MPAPPVKLTGPSIAFGATVVLSLVVIFSGAESLALRGVHPTALTWMIIVSLTMVFGVSALLIRFLSNVLINSSRRFEEQRPAQLKKPKPNAQIHAPQTGPMQPPISSVTDHTTRTFEPAYRERGK
jgi:hypothetical protein